MKRMTLKNWLLAICGIMVIVSAVLKIFHVTKVADTLFYAGAALFFLTLAFRKQKKKLSTV
jgi:hypothetical protein